MANKGSSSTPEIKINFSYESKTSANKKLKERISEVQQVAKGISVGIDFKANSESMKSLKSSLTTVKNNLNKLTLDAFNSSLKEALANSDKIAKNLEKASKAVAKSKLITKTGNTEYDLKAVKEAEKKSIEAIKAQQKAYADMVKASKAELQELAKAEKLAKKESEKGLESLAKAQDSFDKKKQKALDAITAKEQKAIEKTTQQQQKALDKQQKEYEKALNSILKQKEALELGTQTKAQKIEFKQADYQRVLDYITQSGSIAQDTIDELQERINSLSIETPRQELKELATDLSTLGKNDTNFTNLTKKLGDFKSKLAELRTQAIDLNNEEALKKLDELENQIKDVEVVSEELSDGLSVNMNKIKPTINEIDKGFKDVSKTLKETQVVATGFGATFKQIAVTFGLLDIGRNAVNTVVSSFREGISTVVDMDSALADFNKVVDMSSAGLDRVRTSAVAMGQELGSSAVEVVKAQAEFGRVYKDLDTINKMTETAIMGANVMDGLSVDQVAKGLNTVISSLKLSTEDVTTILDSMNEVQNNFNISSTNMLEALGKVGSTAYTAGASLQQLEGYITAITDATGADGGEIGNSLRSVMTRIYKIGQDAFDEGDPEEALKAIGVAVRDASGEFRNINDILVDLDKTWGSLSQTEKIATAQVVAGINQYDKFVSLMNNFTVATEATATAMDSAGSATKENEIYLQSIEGRMKSLQATMDGFWTTLIDSDLVKSGVDLLQALANALVGLQDTFGSTGATLITLTTAFGLFTDNPLKSFAKTIAESESPTKTFVEGLKDLFKATNETSSGMTKGVASAKGLASAFTEAGAKALLTKASVVALEVAMSALTGVLLSLAVSGIGMLIDQLFNADKRMAEAKQSAQDLANALQTVNNTKATMSEYAEVSKSLEAGIAEEEKRLELLTRQKELKEQLAMSSEEASVIMANDNLSYERQLELLNNINQKKLEEKALDLDKSYRNGLFEQDQQKVVENYRRGIEENIKSLEKLQELQKQANGETIKDGGFTYTAEQLQKGIDELKKKISDSLAEIDSYNSGVELMEQVNIDTERTTVDLTEKIKQYLETLKQSTDALDENTEAKKQNALVDGFNQSEAEIAKSMQVASEEYSASITALQQIYDLIEDINEEGAMTPEIASKVLKLFPDIGTRIGDVAEAQEFLNQKLLEQEEYSNQAYETLVLNDTNYYQTKLLNDQAWQEAFRQSLIDMGMSQDEAYSLDLSKFQNLNQLKTYAMNALSGSISNWLNQYIDTSANGYNIDFNNFKSYAEAKEAILKALNEEIKTVTANMKIMEGVASVAQNRVDLYGSASSRYDNLMLEQSKNKIEEYKQQIAGLQGAIKDLDFKVGGIGVGNIQMGGVSFKNPISYSPSGGSSSSNKGNSNKEKENSEYKATLEQWYTLKDAIEDVNNQIEQNQILRARAEGTAKEQEYIKKEVELLKKQIDLKKQLQKEMEKERNNLKSYLMTQGGVFNGENLTNYEKLLGWTATTDEGKEKLQQLEEAVKSYTDLCNSEIPNVKKEWEGLQDQIDELLGTYEKYKVDTEKWFALKDQINDVSVAIERYEYLRNKTTSDKREQEYIQKEIELLQQQITLKKRLQAEMEKEKNQLKALIEASGGKFKGNNLTNYDALFGQEAVGKEAVEKLKELEEAFNRYMELTNSELPSIVMEWEKLQDQIEEVKNSQEKYTASIEKWYKLKDAIEDVNNELELNKIKQEQAVGKDKIELMNKEIALYNKQIELNKQLQKEMEKEKEELKKFIKESGGIFQGDNLINYDDLFGKEVVGSEAVEALKKLEEAVKSYTDLCNSEIPSIVEKWESLNQEIEKVKQQQVDMAIDFEKDLYDVLAYYAKKENDLRKKDIENEKKAVEEKKKLLEERKKLLQETFDKEDREDALAEAQQTLAELDAQIQEALRSGDRELVKRLREQYAEAQKSLNEQIRDQERENALDQFDDIAESYDKEIEDLDDLIEELDKKLEEYLDPMNISKVIASAMNSGFVDIMGQTVEVNKVMSDFLKETTTGVYTTKEALKELEEQLKNIGAVASQLPGISDSLGLPDYSSSLNSRSAEIKTSQLVLNSPLVNIESLDNNSIAEFNEIMNDKINWLIGQINDKFNY